MPVRPSSDDLPTHDLDDGPFLASASSSRTMLRSGDRVCRRRGRTLAARSTGSGGCRRFRSDSARDRPGCAGVVEGGVGGDAGRIRGSAGGPMTVPSKIRWEEHRVAVRSFFAIGPGSNPTPPPHSVVLPLLARIPRPMEGDSSRRRVGTLPEVRWPQFQPSRERSSRPGHEPGETERRPSASRSRCAPANFARHKNHQHLIVNHSDLA